MTAGFFTLLLQKATTTIPVLTVMDDLLAQHAVASLAHPGGNTTGIGIFAPELDAKRQEILLEVLPETRRLAVLGDPAVTRSPQLKALEDAAKARGIEVSTYLVANASEISPAMDAAAATGARRSTCWRLPSSTDIAPSS
jgi:ABC-type uncharacterized transport system substrate-binding protein